MQPDPARLRFAQQVLDAAEAAGLFVYQQFGSAFVCKRVHRRLLPAPQKWERLVGEFHLEIATLLDARAPRGCAVHRAPGSSCLVYLPHQLNREFSPVLPADDGDVDRVQA